VIAVGEVVAKVTVPLGVGVALTVAVKTTAWPDTDEGGVAIRAVPVLALLTVNEAVLEADA
jgi:hypothetical protein